MQCAQKILFQIFKNTCIKAQKINTTYVLHWKLDLRKITTCKSIYVKHFFPALFFRFTTYFFFQIKHCLIKELQMDVSFIKLRQLNFQQSNISCWKLWMFLVKCQTNTQSIVIFCPWFSQLAIAPMTGLRTKSVTKILENVCVWLNSLETDVKLVSKG